MKGIGADKDRSSRRSPVIFTSRTNTYHYFRRTNQTEVLDYGQDEAQSELADSGGDAAICAAIVEDSGAIELDAEWFLKVKPIKEVLPEFWEWWYGNGQQTDDSVPDLDNGLVQKD